MEWKALGEVAEYQQPTKYLVKSKKYNNEFNTPVLTAGKTFILGYTDETDGIYNAQEKPVIIFDDFTTANKWVDFDFKAKSSAMKMITSKDKSDVLLKYVFYWLNTLPSELIYSDHKRQWISNYSKKKIPVPSLAEQTRIVDILDKFDALTHSISDGLPREIKLRQQQYEYYRDLLLSFPKSETTA
ncbi:restriction endonuclease subunit S [Methylococcaceae bacterium HT2]|nr:restriction endonuclease subunit S [Methylococcaceae bacterium HT2]